MTTKFDPKTGEVPGWPFHHLSGIAWRARHLLRHWTAEQIAATCQAIDRMIDEHFKCLRDEARLRLGHPAERGPTSVAKLLDEVLGKVPPSIAWEYPDDEELDVPTRETEGEVATLEECIHWWPEYGDDMPDAKPYELFAALSLLLVEKAMYWIKRDLLAVAGDKAIQAMEAVSHAEHLYSMETSRTRAEAEFQQAELERRRERSKALNAIRHRRTDTAKEMVITEWTKNRSNWPSAAQAGNDLADYLKTQSMKYEPRTVTGWILSHAKKMNIKLR